LKRRPNKQNKNKNKTKKRRRIQNSGGGRIGEKNRKSVSKAQLPQIQPKKKTKQKTKKK